jgi:UDP-2,4-diacetamido-2,4,6-trideoxy-beta-L-altropyranose hydrolase
MRCATLSTALRGLDHCVTVITAGMPAWVQQRFDSIGCAVVIGDSADLAEVARPDVWIVDGYTLGAELEHLIADGNTVMAIDDNHELPVDGAALVLNQNLHATPALYPDVAPQRLLLGPRFALIRSDVCDLDPAGLPDVGSVVLLAFGGTDPARLTLPMAVRLAATGNTDIIVALGAEHPDRAAVGALAGVRFDGGDLRDGFSESHVAVIGGGSTLWEVGVVGLPSLAVVVADNQVEGTAAAVAAGFVESADVRASGFDVDHLVERTLGLLDDRPRRAAMAAAGRTLFDGDGRWRVAAAVSALA